MSKNSSLHKLRQDNKDTFFLSESEDENNQGTHDDDELDIDNMDFPLPTDDPTDDHGISSSAPLTPDQLAQIQALMGSGAVGNKSSTNEAGVRYVSGDEANLFKSWMCLYPCYIDGTKTVAEGRRIPKHLACTMQPWAKDIVEALKEMRLSQAFEPGKTHPRDWENRGRVRVLFKENGRFCHPTIHTKRELLVKLAASINRVHAKEAAEGKERPEFSPLSPLTPLSIVAPGMANANPLAGFLGDTNEPEASSSTAAASNDAQPSTESKRQKKLAKRPKRVMIRG
ncbi:signal recognition particle subunit [Lunasporangiospora selenospora]|uniref:Signal recognition particle subunit n=1 Tax=Lunasporangiospora selenospora TaxID=979761 RepID=A0A9P6FUC9_9FUNG|nr:signal recognition particle subunit [Lunasporangiospora selenospora]